MNLTAEQQQGLLLAGVAVLGYLIRHFKLLGFLNLPWEKQAVAEVEKLAASSAGKSMVAKVESESASVINRLLDQLGIKSGNTSGAVVKPDGSVEHTIQPAPVKVVVSAQQVAAPPATPPA